ncbi:plasminogen-like [Tachypleus tridentatus]|uniref:plasminogen-like n=1 Tax=Tachypleus tridentatus TaxID=6853 RepID=UPI003FD6821C
MNLNVLVVMKREKEQCKVFLALLVFVGWSRADDSCREILLKDRSGVINSPTDPKTGKYPPNSQCFWDFYSIDGIADDQGDSGRPLVAPKDNKCTVYGLVSWGPLVCGIKQEPTVYMRVSAFRQWID